MLILLLFFCSGATALVYEVLWSKYLTLLFGSTIQAQTVVLAAFMGGLALGNKLFSRHADTARRPLVIYGVIETLVGLWAFFFPLIYKAAEALFASAGSLFLHQTALLLLWKGALSAAMLLGPTILMGGTLPILAAWLQKNTPEGGRRTARFYSINSLGAVAGAGLAGFVLVQWLGMSGTMEVTALVNLAIGLTAITIGWKPLSAINPGLAGNQQVEGAKAGEQRTPGSLLRWGCILVATTGAVSMGLEVLASRCLSLVFGASLQVFAIVLMAFILGIGVGSAIIASPRWKRLPKEAATAGLLLSAAILIGLAVFNIENLVQWYRHAQSGLTRTPVGFVYHQLMIAAFAIAFLSLPAGALGAVLPMWIRVVSESSPLLGDRVGRLLTWNTLGAVGGVMATGFVLMPRIGLRGSFGFVAMLLTAAAVVTALATRRRVIAGLGVACGGLLILVLAQGGESWRQILSSGVFRLPDTEDASALLAARPKNARLLFYEDAADATVTVDSELMPSGVTNISLRINGKPDASSPGDLSTQILLGQLPMMMKPDSTEVFCLGMGSGISAGTTLGYPIDHLTVADNCEPVLRAAKWFAPWNNGLLTNSRTILYHEDARTVLKLSPKKYDVIISEPSNPWMVGIGSVFSREFYKIAASRLKPGGIMSQWLYTYELDDNILELVVRTFGSVFPHMEIWDVGEGDIVILGSDRAWKSDPDVYKRGFEYDGPRHDLASIGLTSPAAVLARQFASQRTAFAMPGPGRLQTDNEPILEYEAPRQFYIYLGRGAQQFQNFDERTWQMELASAEKNEALAKLDMASIAMIFGGVAPSVNHDLQTYLINRAQGNVGNMIFGNRVMPCVFDSTGVRPVVYNPPSSQTNVIPRQLYLAEVALRTDNSKRQQAVDSIKNMLNAVQSFDARNSDWSPAYYADLAVKASLRLGNRADAKTILLRGLQLEPDSEELKYVSRILDREGVFQQAALAQTPVH